MSDDDALTLEAFLARVGELRRRRPTRIRNALRRIVLPDSGASCWHCGQPAKHVEALIPERAGGTIQLENLVAACGWCRRVRGDLDPLAFAESRGVKLSVEQLGRRLKALSVSGEPDGVTQFSKLNKDHQNSWQTESWHYPRVPLVTQHVGHRVLVALLQATKTPSSGMHLQAIKADGGVWAGPFVVQIGEKLWESAARKLLDQHAVLISVGASSGEVTA